MRERVTRVPKSAPAPKSDHPIDVANVTLPPELAKSRYGKWRALSLIMVYVLMIVHITHWKVAGKTMAPLELSEIMKALELRVLSAGVIFMGIMLVGSLIFGRFFCSWGCHMLALQDLSHWILKKLRIRPRPIRSRVLLLVPLGAATYMFVWPQIKRMWLGLTLPEASSRLTTTDFWRDLPGPLVITLTALTCGFLIIYFFGGRGFCTYGCPYGVLFGLFDRVAPGKIRARDGCEQCGKCTAICTSNIRVHEEVKAYGMVVHPQCMKDMDCVSVCPKNVLHFGFGMPSLVRSRKEKAPPVRYDFSIPEEIAMVAIFVGALYTWRGLYDRLPFLMSLALSAVTAYLTITFARLAYRKQLTLNRYSLKVGGRILRPGYAFGVGCAAFLAFTAHSAFVQYHKRTGAALIADADHLPGQAAQVRAERTALLTRAVGHLSVADRVGLASSVRQDMRLGTSLLELGRASEAEVYLRRAVERAPTYPEARVRLAGALAESGRDGEAETHLATALQIYSPHEEYEERFQHLYADAHVQWGNLLSRAQRFEEADTHFREALSLEEHNSAALFGLALSTSQRGHLAEAAQLYGASIAENPNSAEAHSNLGDVRLAMNDPEGALSSYRSALAVDAEIDKAHFKIGVISFHLSQMDEALTQFEVAMKRSPDDAEVRNYYGQTLEQVGRPQDARAQFEEAVRLDENLADAHFNLGRMCATTGQNAVAERHLQRAVQLDPRYGNLTRSRSPSGR